MPKSTSARNNNEKTLGKIFIRVVKFIHLFFLSPIFDIISLFDRDEEKWSLITVKAIPSISTRRFCSFECEVNFRALFFFLSALFILVRPFPIIIIAITTITFKIQFSHDQIGSFCRISLDLWLLFRLPKCSHGPDFRRSTRACLVCLFW